MRGGFIFTAVPAEDGFGSEQVSWVITAGEHRLFHGGDTLWHGQWNTIGKQFGPFDIAFLPINGARVGGDPLQETPAVLTPAQAVDAAISIRANVLIPIHYGLNDPPNYVEADKPIETLLIDAKRRGVGVRNLLPGDNMTLNE